MSNLLKKDKGFTLIEIVLVLAIAGLLLVIVFLAVQGANRSRRDAQRKQDAARMLAAMESCAANNNGSYTAGTGCLTQPALMDSPNTYFKGDDPTSQSSYIISTSTPAAVREMHPGTGSCPGTTGGTAYVQVYQEAGGSYCAHN